jgi:NAD(P)-dependent dehydrogenase (short-subunit alcohol dehydrogenase family)
MKLVFFLRLYAINQRGVWLCQKYEALQMKKQELLLPLGTSSSLGGVPQRGAICNTASMCGHMSEGMPCYTATKHAILGITKTGGMFYGPHGIRCNALSPGCVLTEEYESWRQTLKGDRFHVQATGWKDRTPLHRASTPAEQANVASFLLSGESSFVNCANIIVDGGLTVCIDK